MIHRKTNSSARRTWAALVGLAMATPGILRAQDPCALAIAEATPAPRTWSPPLDRVVAVRLRGISLRDALDRLSTAAHLRFSYSAELLPLDRRVCVPRDSVSVGDALLSLVRGTAVEPVIVSSEQVVLAPARVSPDGTREPEATLSRGIGVLDRVVVTGNVVASSERSLTVGLDVVDGTSLRRANTTTLSQTLDGYVPGLWMWEQSPTSLLAGYGSIRGASSFGLSYPKIYIDGIEVANPLLIAQFTPETVERVEVIRGPQGAALYGSDAISGVINIITNQGAPETNGQRASVQTGFGVSQSAFASRAPLVQAHAFTLRGGSPLRSADLAVRAATLGDFMPGASARQLSARGGVRLIGSQLTFAGSARLFAEDAGVARSPLLVQPPAGFSQPPTMRNRQWVPDPFPRYRADSMTGEPVDSTAPQSVRQYTVGTTTTFVPDARWTHSFVAGLDGYRLSNVLYEGGAMLTPTDSALQAARGGADRATFRVSSVARFGQSDLTSSTLTLSAEHAALREETAWTLSPHDHPGDTLIVQRPWVHWQSNTGVLAQLNTSISNQFFITAGARLEHNDALADGSFATLPMLGAALVRDLGMMSVKLRSAYGKGIRSPQTPSRALASLGSTHLGYNASLAPEKQEGVEAGFDMFVDRRFSLHVTRFDQIASGLIQKVFVFDSSTISSPFMRRVSSELQNVGRIENRGWELQTAATAGRLTMSGTWSQVDSRVTQLAKGYGGDLRPGDRMLGVPARTANLTGAWSAPRWSGSITASRAWDWINYDRVGLGKAVADPTRSIHDVTGAQLRSYWLRYNGATHLRVAGSRDITRSFALMVGGDNLLNWQTGEPDNASVVPGRTITAGLRARF